MILIIFMYIFECFSSNRCGIIPIMRLIRHFSEYLLLNRHDFSVLNIYKYFGKKKEKQVNLYSSVLKFLKFDPNFDLVIQTTRSLTEKLLLNI